MRMTRHPLTDLSRCIGHAIHKDVLSHPKFKWLSEYRASDIEIHAMFVQMWESTALGFGGVGGAAMTEAYTTVLCCHHTSEFLVYFNGHFAYAVARNCPVFVEDIKNRNAMSVAECGIYKGVRTSE